MTRHTQQLSLPHKHTRTKPWEKLNVFSMLIQYQSKLSTGLPLALQLSHIWDRNNVVDLVGMLLVDRFLQGQRLTERSPDLS